MISYKVVINKGEYLKEWTYNYASTKGIVISLGNNCAQIAFNMTVKKSFSDLSSLKPPLVRDAYRKIYQLHAVIFDYGLKVDVINVYIDDEKKSFNSNCKDFPFLFSMINDEKLGLNESWKGLDTAIMSATKTSKDSDLRFAAMFSYLASRSREYEMDRFANLWTAMNSYYSYVNKCYESYLQNAYKISDEKHIKSLCISQEADLIGAALWQIDSNYTKFTKSEANKIWGDDYSIENELLGYSDDEIVELYNALFDHIRTNKLSNKYSVFKDRATEFGLSPFTFMLFEYTYHWRCKLFHGNRSTLLFLSYTDYEMYVLKTINYFLDRYLNETIPLIFNEKFWDYNRQNAMEEYICNIKEGKELRKYQSILDQYRRFE